MVSSKPTLESTMKHTLLAAATLLATLSPAAQAVPLTYYFSGQVTSLSDDNSGTFASTFALGQAVSGSWTFDSAATGTSILPYATSYASTFTVTIGTQTFSGVSEYRIFDDAPGGGDGFSVINEAGTYSAPALGPLTPRTFFLQNLGMPTSTLASQALVLDPAAIAGLASPAYAPNGLRLDNPDGSYGLLYFSAAVVPEPSSAWLAVSALVVAGAVWRRRAEA
jgi:hypothetical protein